MKEEIKSFAKIFGLSLYESRVYLSLVRIGPSLVQQIAKETNLSRTALYSPINSLLEKGFLGIIMRGKRKYYIAVAPERLNGILRQRQVELKNLLENIATQKKISSKKDEVDIVYFPGRHGIATAGKIFLEETKNKTWLSFENPVTLTELVGLDFETDYIEQRIEASIKSKMIISIRESTPWLRDFLSKDKEQLRETLMISPHDYPFDSTIVTTKGLTLQITSKGNPFAVLIRNEYIANTMASIHKLIWNRSLKNS